ncbi:hypothetical protein LSAT2_018787 [Lamellibrachia satsuma]|nr:hypothetical protein LSAT2_018787 [Lamellibrachia satsuma]
MELSVSSGWRTYICAAGSTVTWTTRLSTSREVGAERQTTSPVRCTDAPGTTLHAPDFKTSGALPNHRPLNQKDKRVSPCPNDRVTREVGEICAGRQRLQALGHLREFLQLASLLNWIEPRALALSTVSCLRRTAALETCDSVVSKIHSVCVDMSSKYTLMCVVVYILAVASSKRTETAEKNMVLKSRWPTHSSLFQYYLKWKKPWLLLPNSNRCYHNKCESSNDCCRMYNICDRSARVCIDCWYTYPCLSDGDCCEQFPVCSKMTTKKSFDGSHKYGICTR